MSLVVRKQQAPKKKKNKKFAGPKKLTGLALANQQRQLQQMRGTGMSGGPLKTRCAQMYQMALYNAFAEFPHPPCIPDQFALPSQKYNTRARGQAKVGTAGMAQITVFPWMMAFRDANYIHDDLGRAGIMCTNGAWSGTGVEVGFTVVADAGIDTVGNNSPYTALQFDGTDRIYRLVGSCIKAAFTGTPLTKKGSWIMWRSPNNSAAIESVTTSGVLELNTTTRLPIQSDVAVYQNYIPTKPEDLAYLPVHATGGYTTGRFASGGNNQSLLVPFPQVGYFVALQGGVPGDTIDFEVVSHFELIGTGVPLTPSHSDVKGLADIISASSSVSHDPNPDRAMKKNLARISERQSENKPLQLMGSLASAGINALTGNFGGAAMSVLSGLGMLGKAPPRLQSSPYQALTYEPSAGRSIEEID